MLSWTHQKGAQLFQHLDSSSVNPCWISGFKEIESNRFMLYELFAVICYGGSGKQIHRPLKEFLSMLGSYAKERANFCKWLSVGLQNELYLAKSLIQLLLIRERGKEPECLI